ncbi:MAG: sialidase family protein [Chloroflexi bacterium]|nr:sialidase family protein [Chloroflexota bacterium]
MAAATKTDFYVDMIDDSKGLGYPDSRKIVRDSQGNLYIAYRKTFPASKGTFRIFMAKSADNGQSWQVLNHDQPIETVGNYTQRVPSLAIDHNDTLHVVWYGLDESTIGENEREIKYTNSMDGGITWTTWRNIAPVPGYQDSQLWQEHPVIYVDVNNVIYVVWQGEDTAETQIKLTKSTDGGKNWSKWQTINGSATEGFSRHVLVTSNDGAILYLLAYRHSPDQAQIVWSSSRDGGKTWTAWTPIAPDRQDQRHLSAAIDSQNRLYVVWRQLPDDSSKTTKVQVHYAHFDGNRWTAPEIPALQPDQNQFFPSITLDTKNNPWIVWTATSANSDYPTEDPTTGFIYYTTQSNGRWQAPTKLTANTGTYASLIRQVSSVNTEIDVVWLENQSKSEGLICYYSLDRALNTSLAGRRGDCEIASATPSTPASGTPTNTPNPTKTARPTKPPPPTKTPKPTKTPAPTKTPKGD